jgi:hypothetical protein
MKKCLKKGSYVNKEITWCKTCRQVVSINPASEEINRYDGLCGSCKRKKETKPKEKEADPESNGVN